jgi:hypothetical protein
MRHHPQAGRRHLDDRHPQIGPVLLEAEDQLPHSPSEGFRVLAQRRLVVLRIAVVHDDRRIAPAEPLQVHEVAQSELEGMQPVDKCQVDRTSAQDGTEIVSTEEIVAGQLEDVRRGLGIAELWLRIDANGKRLRPGASEGSTLSDPDLDVRSRAQMAVKAIEQIEVIREGLLRPIARRVDRARLRRQCDGPARARAGGRRGARPRKTILSIPDLLQLPESLLHSLVELMRQRLDLGELLPVPLPEHRHAQLDPIAASAESR